MNLRNVLFHSAAFAVASWAVRGADAAQATAALRDISGGRHHSDELSDSQPPPHETDIIRRSPPDTLPPQAAAAMAALEIAAVPVAARRPGSDAPSLVASLQERWRRGILPAVGGEDGMTRRTAHRIGKGFFCVMLLIFIFYFGCCWDDSEGLSAAVSGKLIKSELWSSRPPLAEAAGVQDLQVATSEAHASKLKGFAGPDARRVLPAVLPTAAGDSPAAAARLAVPLSQLQNAAWTADVLGFMGLPVLFARLRGAEDGERFIEVALPAAKETPLVSVSSGLAIRLGGGEALGALVPETGGRCSLVLDGGSVAMAIAGGASPGERLAVLQMPGRRQVGTVSRVAANMAVGEEHLEVSVSAGAEVDAALVLACALASRAFGPDGWA